MNTTVGKLDPESISFGSYTLTGNGNGRMVVITIDERALLSSPASNRCRFCAAAS